MPDGARQRGEQHQQEEQKADDGGHAAHVDEHAGSVMNISEGPAFAATASLDPMATNAAGTIMRPARKETPRSKPPMRTTVRQALLLVEVAAVRDHDAHGQRQAVEHLPDRADDQLRRELAEVGREVVHDAVEGTGMVSV